jgi:hypothetical protein
MNEQIVIRIEVHPTNPGWGWSIDVSGEWITGGGGHDTPASARIAAVGALIAEVTHLDGIGAWRAVAYG